MKPRNQGGVVDARLNVHGVDGLKVAGMQCKIVSDLSSLLTIRPPDMSICPTNVGNVRHTLLHYVMAIFDVANRSFSG